MNSIIERLSQQLEIEPDKHDGSYELVRETVKALSTVNHDELGIEDLDMLYLMTITTSKSSCLNKKKKVDESHLDAPQKSLLKATIDFVEENAEKGVYDNYNKNRTIGMFGTGFFTFKKMAADTDARKFISLCIEIFALQDDDEVFGKVEEVLKNDIKGMGVASISQILHCLRPEVFPILNGGEDAGLQAYKTLGISLIKPTDVPHYITNVKRIRDFRNEKFSFRNYRVIDMFFWENSTETANSQLNNGGISRNYWLFNICFDTKEIWEHCKKDNYFAMQYEYNKQNNSSVTRNIDVAKRVKVGDNVIAYTGDKRLIAVGEVTREFYEEKDKTKFLFKDEGWAQRIGVKWEKVVNEPVKVSEFTKSMELIKPNKLSSQAINQVSENGYNKAVQLLDSKQTYQSLRGNYWWLNAKPSIWSFDNIEVGETIEYTSHTDEGTKRRVFKYFDEAKIGDMVIGYETSPTKAIVAICKISREHDGETIEFEKIRKVETLIGLEILREIKELKEMEAIQNPIGSFFKVTPNEFDVLVELINNKNVIKEAEIPEYSEEDFLKEVFISNEKYKQIMFDLKHKKNLILQGPPGVGKTFVAKRLAYSRMGIKDNSKIQMIQFHQSYSYEDFIQGFRPTEDGKFRLKNGVFYEFCRKAQRDPKNDYYFIIDEINRGNLSKIFGELMMLIEHDKRGAEFEIPLTYSQDEDDKFYIPENLYFIGTMNTADRSLAMVDYALRRRFRFIDIEPAFLSDAFKALVKVKGVNEALFNRIILNLERLNLKIRSDNKNLGKGYQIGHSYFCNTPKDDENQEAWYSRIILSEIKPLLYEYWFDDEDTAEAEVRALL